MSDPIPVLEYSIDNGSSWKDFTFSVYDYSTGHLTSEGTTVTLAQGEKVYLRAKGKNDSFCCTDDFSTRNIRFVMTGSVAASGNIMSLLDKKCALKKIPCKVCFLSLFEDCTVMTSAPEPPAESLRYHCYEYMFRGCTSLKSIKVYFNSWYEVYPSTADWVNGVPAGGTFYYKSGLSDLSESNNKVPSGWTKTQF